MITLDEVEEGTAATEAVEAIGIAAIEMAGIECTAEELRPHKVILSIVKEALAVRENKMMMFSQNTAYIS